MGLGQSDAPSCLDGYGHPRPRQSNIGHGAKDQRRKLREPSFIKRIKGVETVFREEPEELLGHEEWLFPQSAQRAAFVTGATAMILSEVFGRFAEESPAAVMALGLLVMPSCG